MPSAFSSAVNGELTRVFFWTLRQARWGYTAPTEPSDFAQQGIAVIIGPQVSLAWDVPTVPLSVRAGVSRKWERTSASFYEVIVRSVPYTSILAFRALGELLGAGLDPNAPHTLPPPQYPHGHFYSSSHYNRIIMERSWQLREWMRDWANNPSPEWLPQ